MKRAERDEPRLWRVRLIRVHPCSSVVGFLLRLGPSDVDRQEMLSVRELPRRRKARAFLRYGCGAGTPRGFGRNNDTFIVGRDELLVGRDPLAQEVNRSR